MHRRSCHLFALASWNLGPSMASSVGRLARACRDMSWIIEAFGTRLARSACHVACPIPSRPPEEEGLELSVSG
jgi:hypothetical protein